MLSLWECVCTAATILNWPRCLLRVLRTVLEEAKGAAVKAQQHAHTTALRARHLNRKFSDLLFFG
jgi:hypothetical protein